MAEKRHLYQLVYDNLLKDICDGTLTEGTRLPSENELTEQFGVSRITTKKAMNMLAEGGYIIRRPGLGSYVCGPEEAKGDSQGPAPYTAFQNDGRPRIIGLIMEDFTDSYGLEILRSIEKRAGELSYHLCIKRSLGTQAIEKRAVDSLLELNVDGIIIMPTHGQHYNTELLRMVIEGYPIVFIDRLLSGVPAPFVGTNNLGAAEMLTAYLLDMGHRSIAIVTPPAAESISLRDRIDGFRMAYQKRGIEQDRNLFFDNIRSTIPSHDTNENSQNDAQRIELFLKEHPEVTAVIATEYSIAVMVRRATQNMGLRVPDDISLVCFDSPPTLQGSYYFTHIRQNETEIGIRAVDLLRGQIVMEKQSNRQKQVILDAELVNGFSARQV